MKSNKLLKNEKNNNSQKNQIILSLLAIAVLLIITMSFATQKLAEDCAYWEGLGYEFPGIEHFYYPWAIIYWYALWGDDEELFRGALDTATYIFLFGFSTLIIFVLAFKSKLKAIETLHGSAKWAMKADIIKAGLLSDEKIADDKPFVYVGGYKDEKTGKTIYLKHSGPEHVLCYAPTRSGKGVGLVIPTLLEWKASAVITDLKGELWALTAGFRKEGLNQKVIRFEPAAAGSAKWNPLAEIRIGTSYEVGDAQNLANMIVDPDGKGLEGQDGHWKKTAFALYTGLIIHVLYLEKNGDLDEEASLHTIDHLLSDTSRDISELWLEMTKYKHFKKEGKVHPVVAAAGKDQLDRPKDEGGSVLSTVKSNLSLYRDPIVTANTRKSDFNIKDIMNANTPVSLYVVTQPNDKTRLKPLIRMFLNMTVRLLADEMKFVNGRAMSCNKHKLLMMLDEFPSLGKLDIMQESLAFVAGYGIKCYLITQDLSQLKNDYGQNESITSNCHIQNAYPPNRMDTAEYLSKMTGQTTIVKEAITKSGKGLNASTSITMQEVQRPLLTADECMRLKGATKNRAGEITEAGDMLVFVAGYPAIYGKQILYFQDEKFLKRSKIPAPERTDVITAKDREEATGEVITSKDEIEFFKIKNS